MKYSSKQARTPLNTFYDDEETEKTKWDERWIKVINGVTRKVDQINEYLFSDISQCQKIKSSGDEISQGLYRGYPSKCIVGQVEYLNLLNKQNFLGVFSNCI